MDFVSLVALLALIEYLVISTMTGRARGQYGVKAPAITGHPIFERWYRVQLNTLEQLVVFVPALFLFARYVSPRWGGLLGLVFIVGRAIYARSYVADPESRSLGFALTFIPNVLLLLGALLAVVF
ncbi:MAG TPA: MAPEG family protein [Candidatus Dormibacteraeota bacterium]|nr:MAPEG family protein [Candidatus Dormibacteraeota bacterium]